MLPKGSLVGQTLQEVAPSDLRAAYRSAFTATSWAGCMYFIASGAGPGGCVRRAEQMGL